MTPNAQYDMIDAVDTTYIKQIIQPRSSVNHLLRGYNNAIIAKIGKVKIKR